MLMDDIDNIVHLFETQTNSLLSWARVHSERAGPEELHGFLTGMEMACRHGVKSDRDGFWPFVQQFTHADGLRCITSLDSAATGVGKGRAWLLLALQEGTLEFYFTTFLAHATERTRHYKPTALMRQDAPLKRLVVLLAELATVRLAVSLRPEQYDLERHVCPPPQPSPTDARLLHMLDGFSPLLAEQPGEPVQWSHTGRRLRRSRRVHSSTSSRQSSISSDMRPPGSKDESDASSDVVLESSEMKTPGGQQQAVSPVASDNIVSGKVNDGNVDTSLTPRDVMLRERMSSNSTPSPEPPERQKFTATTPMGGRGREDDATDVVAPSGTTECEGKTAVTMVGSGKSSGVDSAMTKGSVSTEAVSQNAPVDRNMRTAGNGNEAGIMIGDVSDVKANEAETPPASIASHAAASKSLSAASSPGCAAKEASYPTLSAATRPSPAGSKDISATLPTSDDASLTRDADCLNGNVNESACDVASATVDNCKPLGCDVIVGADLDEKPSLSSLVNGNQCSFEAEVTNADKSDENMTISSDTPSLSTSPSSQHITSPVAPLPTDATSPSVSDLPSTPQRRPVAAQPEGTPSTPSRRPSTGVHLACTEAAVRRRPVRGVRLPGAHSDVILRRRASAACLPEKRVTWAGTDRETEAVAAMLPDRGERGAPEGQEDPPRVASRATSTLSISSSSTLSNCGNRGVGAKGKRRMRLYEPSALGSPLPESAARETEQHIAAELKEAQRRRRMATAHSAQVQIDHSLATRLVVSFFQNDEIALPTAFKVLWGDHLSLRSCLLVLTTYRLVILRRGTLRRLRAAAETPSHQQEPDAAYPYFSIASVKVAFHGQAVALQHTDGAYSRWLWLGDQAETGRLITHVQAAIGASPLRPLPPHVHTSQPHRQLYTAEVARRESKPEILYASLVYFEDFEVPGETPKLSVQLMYKTDSEVAWSVGHFVLWDADLLLYPSGSAARAGGPPMDRWSLPAVTACRRLTALLRPHQLMLLTPQRRLILAAPDADASAHIRDLVTDVMELTVPDRLPSPVPRCVVLTRRALYMLEELDFSPRVTPGYQLCPQGHLVTAAGILRALASVNADSHAAVHLEFDSADAGETTGSWRLYFLSLSEQRHFLQRLMDAYRARNQLSLTIGSISHHMREVCRSGSRYVRARWDGIAD